MRAAGVKTSVPLDELESHLREDVGVLVSAGTPEAQAFQLAVSRLGSPVSVRTEFNKIKSAHILPVKIGSALWIVMTTMQAGYLSGGLFPGRWDLLVKAQVLSLTSGYTAAFLAGIFGICYVCYRSLHALSPARQQSLSGAVFLFSYLAAGLAAAGLMLGSLWTRWHLGRFVGGAGPREPLEIGAWCACAWLIALAAMHHFDQISERARMLMSIGGNIIVSLAWFGAVAVVSSHGKHGYATGNYWLLAILLGINLCFLVAGLAPATASRPKNV